MSSNAATRQRLALIPATLALLLMAGCQSQDESSNPVSGGTGGTSGTGGGTGTVSADDIQLSAVGTMDFVNEFVSELDALSSADFSNVTLEFGAVDAMEAPRGPTGLVFGRGGSRTAEEVVWSDVSQSWTLDVVESEVTAEGSGTLTLHFAVQYLSGATPQQWPDETTTAMAVDAAFDLDFDGESEGETFALDFDYGMSMTVGGLQTETYTVDGDGSMNAAILWSGADGSLNLALGMDWLMDVSVPADGCPTGVVTVNANSNGADNFSFVGTYDGTSTYQWTVWDSGVAAATGSEAMDCGTPAL